MKNVCLKTRYKNGVNTARKTYLFKSDISWSSSPSSLNQTIVTVLDASEKVYLTLSIPAKGRNSLVPKDGRSETLVTFVIQVVRTRQFLFFHQHTCLWATNLNRSPITIFSCVVVIKRSS